MFSVRHIINQDNVGKLLRNELRLVLQDFHLQRSVLQGDILTVTLPILHVHKETANSSSTNKLLLQDGDDVNSVPFLFNKNVTLAYTLGNGRNKKVSIVIGIPSVKRPIINYLHDTLQSIFTNIYPSKEEDIAIVTFFAETDKNVVIAELKNISAHFTREINSGLLQVISPSEHLYPDFESLPQTLGDPPARLKWRSKEVFDAAFLMYYCRNLGDYYLMLEDDIIAARGFVTGIEKFAKEHDGKQYGYLSFAGFGSIAKLFRRSDISVWATYLFTFVGTKPIDWLMYDMLQIKACTPEMTPETCKQRIKALVPTTSVGFFQHMGKHSSLQGKTLELKDKKFNKISPFKNNYKNPDAKVFSSFKALDMSTAVRLYNDGGGKSEHLYVDSSNTDDHVTIEFYQAYDVTKVLVKTGREDNSEKISEASAVVETAPANSSSYERCAVFDGNGQAECRLNHTRALKKVRIRMVVKHSAKIWFEVIFIQ